MAANFWDQDEVVRPAPTGAPAAPTGATSPTAVSAPTTPAKNFWDNDTLVRPAPSKAIPTDAQTDVPSEPGGTGKDAPSLAAQAARGLGIGTRGLVQGLVDLPALVSDNLIAKPVNAVLDAGLGEGKGARLKKLGDSTNDLLSRAGLPEAQTDSERVVQDINRGAGNAAAGLGAGAALANAASPVAQAVGRTLQAAPNVQVASGALGSGASGLTREGGGSEAAQVAAGIAGSLAPSLAPYAAQTAVRGALRGGEAGRLRVAENIRTFEEAAGTTPTMGQATQSRSLQAAETGLSNVIGGAGLMARRGEAQAKALEDSVAKLTTELAPDASGWGAGEAITRGVNAFKDSVKTSQKQLYGKLDEFIPAQSPVSVNRTQEALRSLNDGIEGAPNISQFFRNAKISNIERAMLNDLDAATKANVPVGLGAAGATPVAGQLPYQAVQKLRTLVGKEISENSLTADVPRSKWRALYAALSDDLGGAAEAAGPQAQQAWSRANQYTKASIQRMEQLESVVNRNAPEKIFKAATSGLSDGGTQINRVMKSMPLENRREVAAAVLQRLGRARNGQQNEMGDAFSSETFLTNLAAMSAPARMALFSNAGLPGLHQKINQLGRMASIRREGSQVFANPSGTARQIGLGAGVASLLHGIATGNLPQILATLAAPAGASVAARYVTNPDRVRKLGERVVMSEGLAPSQVSGGLRADQGQPQPTFRNRLQAGTAAREVGGVVVSVPGGFAVQQPK